jgi:hypothetical protein
MAKTHESLVDYDCEHIAQKVEILVKTVFAHGGMSRSPIASAPTPQTCTGMPACGLFPSGKFPPRDHALVAPTGCPYMAKRTITGR